MLLVTHVKYMGTREPCTTTVCSYTNLQKLTVNEPTFLGHIYKVTFCVFTTILTLKTFSARLNSNQQDEKGHLFIENTFFLSKSVSLLKKERSFSA